MHDPNVPLNTLRRNPRRFEHEKSDDLLLAYDFARFAHSEEGLLFRSAALFDCVRDVAELLQEIELRAATDPELRRRAARVIKLSDEDCEKYAATALDGDGDAPAPRLLSREAEPLQVTLPKVVFGKAEINGSDFVAKAKAMQHHAQLRLEGEYCLQHHFTEVMDFFFDGNEVY